MQKNNREKELVFLGTGASEAIPAIFCRCGYCEKARYQRGKDIRTRSSFRIDSRHQIDFSPDAYIQMMNLGLDTFDLEHLFITHTHDDHFYLAEILSRECAVPYSDKPLYIYISSDGIEWARNLLLHYTSTINSVNMDRFLDTYRFIPVPYFETFTAGDLKVTSLKANHRGFGYKEYGLNYILELKDGRRLMYAVDTGWYNEETWEFLENRKADLLVIEATFGGAEDRGLHPDGHLDVRSVLLMLERMSAIGLIDGDTKIFTTHINHKHSMMHADLQAAFDRSSFSVTVAYDGLEIR